jgi:hypothetical protein
METALVPWTLEDNGTPVFEVEWTLNPRRKLECYRDERFICSEDELRSWHRIFLTNITARYFMMLRHVDGGRYRRTGIAVMGKYTKFSEDILKR